MTTHRYTEVRSCQGKSRLPKKAAEHTAKLMRQKGENVMAYGCRFCGWYHIGHNSRVMPR